MDAPPTMQLLPETLEAAAEAHRQAIEVDLAGDRGYLRVNGRTYWCQYEAVSS